MNKRLLKSVLTQRSVVPVTRALGVALLLLTDSSVARAVPQTPTCSIEQSSSSEMTELVRQYGLTFDGYGRLCALLRTRGMGLNIVSGSGVLTDRSYGWVSVRLYRKRTGLSGLESRSLTSLSRDASSPEATRLLREALVSVLTEIAKSPERYIASVVEAEAMSRAALAAKP